MSLWTMGPAGLYLLSDNFGAPSTTAPGTSVTPGASNAEGTWTQIHAAWTAPPGNGYWLMLWISGANISGSDKSQLLDIGWDTAGGTNYIAKISNLCCGCSGFSLDGGYYYNFPIFIKSGSTIAARVQGSNATAGTVRIASQVWGSASEPQELKYGIYSETIGTITNSGGPTITPGSSAAEGSWTSLGTTTRNLWWWQLCPQISNGTITALQYAFDLAYGDASNKHFIVRRAQMFVTGTVEKVNYVHPAWCYCDVPSGATIYCRASCSGSPVTGINVTAVAVGG